MALIEMDFTSGGVSKKQYLSTWFNQPKFADLNNDVPIYYNLKMRVINNSGSPTTYKDVILVSVKSDSTESTIALQASIPNEAISSFKILKVVPCTINDVNIYYRWIGTNGYESIKYRKNIRIALDGTLSSPAASTAVASAETASYTYDCTMGVGYRDYSAIQLMKRYTKSTNTVTSEILYDTSSNMAWTNYISVQDVRPNVSDMDLVDIDYNKCILKCGVFFSYKQSNVWYPNISLASDYYGGFRYGPLSNVSSDLANIGVEKHYVLGSIKNGYFATISWNTNCIYIWLANFFAAASLNNQFSLVATIDFSPYTDLVNNNVISFHNDTFITDTGNRYCIVYKNGEFGLIQIAPLILSDINPIVENVYPGRDSDMMYGVMVFE